MPTTDSGLIDFGRTWMEQLVPVHETYGVSSAQSTLFQTAFGEFESAYNAVSNKLNRTPALVALKNDKRDSLKKVISKIAMIVQGQFDITSQQLYELSLKPRDVEPTPQPIPATQPGLRIRSRLGWDVQIELYDVLTGKRGKPEFVSGAAVFAWVGAGEPDGQTPWKFVSNVSRSRFTVPFDNSLPPGTKVHITAAWFNNRKATGPAADAVSTTLVGGAENTGGPVKESA